MRVTRDGVTVPFPLECGAIGVDAVEKQKVEEPKVFRLVGIEVVAPFESREKGAPSNGKLGPHFHPHALYTCVPSRAMLRFA